MYYTTMRNLPRISTYEQARKKYQSTTPIRGRDTDVRPLAMRERVDSFSIRMPNGETGRVELVLQGRPVITFYPDSTVVVAVGRWPEANTNDFVNAILPAIWMCTHKKHTLCTLNSFDPITPITPIDPINPDAPKKIQKKEYVLGRDEKLILKLAVADSIANHDAWEVLEKPSKVGYTLDVRAANRVLKQYKEFMAYCKSMAKLRVNENGYIDHTPEELYLRTYTHSNVTHLQDGKAGDDKYEHYAEAFIEFGIGIQRLLSLINNLKSNPNRVFHTEAKAMIENVREMILKHHAKEVLVHTQLADGKVPNPRYAEWAEREEWMK